MFVYKKNIFVILIMLIRLINQFFKCYRNQSIKRSFRKNIPIIGLKRICRHEALLMRDTLVLAWDIGRHHPGKRRYPIARKFLAILTSIRTNVTCPSQH